MAREMPSPKELPPRARRIRVFSDQPGIAFGTTSACAENTNILWGQVETGGNYLRVRGEYCRRTSGNDTSMELPPRARRIPTISLP